MTDTLLVDVSHWQGTIDWNKFRSTMPYLLAAILKCTQGDATSPYRKDAKFSLNKSSCQSLEIPWGAYHFFEPKYDSVSQANWFVENVGTGCSIYVADIENNKKADGTSFSNSEMMSRTKAFCERVTSLTGTKPMIYTSYGLWNTWCVGTPVWWSKYPLWVAHYTVSQTPKLPIGWTNYKIWQYTSKGDGKKYGMQSFDLDMNRFNGTPEQLVAFFKNGKLPSGVPLPPLPPIPDMVTVNTANLNIRSGAGVEYRDIGDTPLNSVWLVEGVEYDKSGKIWYKVGRGVYLAGWLVNPSGVLVMESLDTVATRIKCQHCGSKFIEDQRGNCLSCGAPNRA